MLSDRIQLFGAEARVEEIKGGSVGVFGRQSRKPTPLRVTVDLWKNVQDPAKQLTHHLLVRQLSVASPQVQNALGRQLHSSRLKNPLLCRNVKRFRGGLVFKAHGLLHHSTLGSRVIKVKRQGGNESGQDE